MKYPDGKKVTIGDVIWWNEGSNKGRVALVLESENSFTQMGISLPGAESEDQLESYGVSEKGIFICANLSNEELTTDVFCAESDFEDEGIGLCLEGKE